MKKGICLILMATGVIFRAAAQETEEVRQEAEISACGETFPIISSNPPISEVPW